MFARPEIMGVMSKHLTLRDVGALSALCKWDARWCTSMTVVLHMHERARLRWPYTHNVDPDDTDVFAILRDRAKWALYPYADVTCAFVWTCWIGQCGHIDARICTINMTDQRFMPYTTCNDCFYRTFHRHAEYTHRPCDFYYVSMVRALPGCKVLQPFLREYKLSFLITRTLQMRWMDAKRNQVVRCITTNADGTKYYSTADVSAMLVKHMAKYGLLAKWARYQSGKRIPRPVKKRRTTRDKDDEEWVE